MERALQLLERLVDNFNMGRALIYTLSCLFFTVPLSMAGNLLVCGPGMSLRETLTRDISFVERHFVGICLFSYVFSFTFTSSAYALKKKKEEEDDEKASDVQYLAVRDKDVLQWYISEYHRFWEAAYYVPLGMVLGAWCAVLYFLGLGCFMPNGPWPWPALFLAAVLAASLSWIFWKYWLPGVVDQVEAVCASAKKNLVANVEGLPKRGLQNTQRRNRYHDSTQGLCRHVCCPLAAHLLCGHASKERRA